MRTGDGGVTLVCDFKASGRVLAFICQKPFECPPARVEHRFGHPCLDELETTHVTDDYFLVPIYKPPRELMQGIRPAAGDLLESDGARIVNCWFAQLNRVSSKRVASETALRSSVIRVGDADDRAGETYRNIRFAHDNFGRCGWSFVHNFPLRRRRTAASIARAILGNFEISRFDICRYACWLSTATRGGAFSRRRSST
jgi:hypothetical protein